MSEPIETIDFLVVLMGSREDTAAWAVVQRLAKLGAQVEAMPRDSRLAHHSSDLWEYKLWSQPTHPADLCETPGETLTHGKVTR